MRGLKYHLTAVFCKFIFKINKYGDSMPIIGREKEKAELERLYESNRAEFVAIYGRRRVGKTYLIDETFTDRITFRHAGLSPIELGQSPEIRPIKLQLQAFYFSLLRHGMKKSHCPKDWLEAFFMLSNHLQNIDDGSRQLVFIDELPWLDTPKSGFITGLEAFWNGWACSRHNLMLVICGSANSWILDKLINNHGGLYGRLTYQIRLSPFSLKECEEFFASKEINLSRYDIIQSYMIVGGIPYYLNYFQRGKSLAQNIDDLFFTKNAKLSYEYDRLFASIFSNPDTMKTIIEVLSRKSAGFTKKEISQKTGLSDNGTLTDELKALISSDFVLKYFPFGIKRAEAHYKLIDPFCLFNLHFVHGKTELDSNFWMNRFSSGQVVAWRGYAFENVCFNHIDQIKQALGISGVSTSQSSWSKRADDTEGTQIDLLIVRRDNVVNMCEIKYCDDLFAVDLEYDRKLRHRQALLHELLPKKIAVHNTLITTFGVDRNTYWSIFDRIVIMDDLFK